MLRALVGAAMDVGIWAVYRGNPTPPPHIPKLAYYITLLELQKVEEVERSPRYRLLGKSAQIPTGGDPLAAWRHLDPFTDPPPRGQSRDKRLQGLRADALALAPLVQASVTATKALVAPDRGFFPCMGRPLVDLGAIAKVKADRADVMALLERAIVSVERLRDASHSGSGSGSAQLNQDARALLGFLLLWKQEMATALLDLYAPEVKERLRWLQGLSEVVDSVLTYGKSRELSGAALKAMLLGDEKIRRQRDMDVASYRDLISPVVDVHNTALFQAGCLAKLVEEVPEFDHKDMLDKGLAAVLAVQSAFALGQREKLQLMVTPSVLASLDSAKEVLGPSPAGSPEAGGVATTLLWDKRRPSASLSGCVISEWAFEMQEKWCGVDPGSRVERSVYITLALDLNKFLVTFSELGTAIDEPPMPAALDWHEVVFRSPLPNLKPKGDEDKSQEREFGLDWVIVRLHKCAAPRKRVITKALTNGYNHRVYAELDTDRRSGKAAKA